MDLRAKPPESILDYISIPEHLKSEPIGPREAMLAGGRLLGARLCYVFKGAGIHVLGDLHGKRWSDLARYRNCGPLTMSALRRLILRALHPSPKPDLGAKQCPVPYWWPSDDIIQLPEAACGLRISALPASGHLRAVLRTLGIEQLGQLQGVAITTVLAKPSFGPKALDDLKSLLARAESGEFTMSEQELASKPPADLLRLIDEVVTRLPERRRRFLEAYFAGTRPAHPSLRLIGRQYGISGARVGQEISKALQLIRCEGNTRLSAVLHLVESACKQAQTPLAPEMISSWQDPARPFRYRPEFYGRLIHRLRCAADRAAQD